MVALLHQPGGRLRPPRLKTNDILPSKPSLLHGSFFASLSLSYSFPLFLSFSLAEHIPSWYISPSPIMDVEPRAPMPLYHNKKNTLRITPTPKREYRWWNLPQTKPEPPGWTDPKAHHFSSYESQQINVLIVYSRLIQSSTFAGTNILTSKLWC